MDIDWSKFPEVPDQTIYCRCGAIYRSNAKLMKDKESFTTWTQLPCPGCSRTHGHVKRMSSDPEVVTLRR